MRLYTKRIKKLLALALAPILLINMSSLPAQAQAQATPIIVPVNPLEAGISEIENNLLLNKPNYHFDLFHLANQRIEIYNGQNTALIYNLNEYQIELPTLAYTQSKIYYNKETSELIIEATRGANNEGGSGTLVARHIITNLKLKTWTHDAELVILFDQEGRLSAIDKNYLVDQAFKAPIPLFQNLWKHTLTESANFSEAAFKVSFLTRGTNPDILNNRTTDSVIPLDHKQKPYLNAGDIYIESTNLDSKKTTVGIFSRDVIYEKIIQDYKILTYMAALANPQPETIEHIEGILKEIENKSTQLKAAVYKEQMNPLFKQVLSQFRKEQIDTLLNRTKSVSEAQSRVFDPLTDTADWSKDFKDLVARAQQTQTDPAAIKSTIDTESDWFQYLEKAKENNKSPLSEKAETRLHKFTRTIKKGLNLKTLGVFFSVTSVTYLSLPFLHDAAIMQEQIKALSWFYEMAYPDILKDATYRVPLLLSTVSLMALWPEAVALSALAGKAFKKMATKLTATDQSKWAKTVRDLARQWGDLNNWQRITSLGMRIYAYLIYPYWRVLVDLVLRQKTFFTALENGLNPFEKIIKNSALGEKFGLTKDQRIGLNSILTSNQKIEQRSHQNLQLQSALKDQKNQSEKIAWTLATAIAAEKYQIDPATLMLLAEEKEITMESLDDIFNSKVKKEKWKLLANEINIVLSEMSSNLNSNLDLDLKDLSANEMQKLYSKISSVSDKIMKLNSVQLKLRSLNYQFKNSAKKFVKAALMIGKNDFKFLKSVYTNEFVSKQVQQEFTVDHAMVVGIVAFYGDRANLTKPEQLAADASGFLWTSKAHWYDVFLNTFAHFFMSGASMALVFQKPKTQLSRNYEPKEHYIYSAVDREQGLRSATYHWIKDVANPLKADLGGIMIKRFFKRFTTFTAGLTMSVGLRTALYSAQLGTTKALLLAKGAWLFNFFAAQWFYGWIWDPVQRGNQLESERFSENQEKLKAAQYKLNRGDPTEALAEIMALYIKENPQDLLTIQKQVLAASPELKSIINLTSVHKVSVQESVYFGLLLNLSYALAEQNSEKILDAKNKLINYSSQGVFTDSEDLKKLSAQNLLKFSISNPPVYTTPNRVLSWITTSIGAVGSTILAIPLSVTLTNHQLMGDHLYLLKWVGISLSAYAISYILLSKNMAEKYVDLYKNKLKPTLDKFKSNNSSTKKYSCRKLLLGSE